jgi:hypothetical protein
MTTNRHKFQFSNATAQNAEARLNVRETLEALKKRVPAHLQEEPEETTAAGKCFRNVSRILARAGK